MNKSPAPAGRLRWFPLQPADLDAMHALHRRSIADLPAQAVKPESREFLDSLLRGRGRVLGVWDGGVLVAYGVLQHDLLPDDNPRALLGLTPTQPLVKLAGAAVDARWRGQGLQRALIARRLDWCGTQAVFATAGPSNPASWRSLLACGLLVHALERRYGGLVRYLLARVPGQRFEWDATRVRTLDGDALDEQQRLLHQGWRGVAPGGEAGQLCLLPPLAESQA